MEGFSLPPVRREEVLRYAGAAEASPELSALLEDAIREAEGLLCCRVCRAVFPVRTDAQGVDLTFALSASRSLAEHLAGCRQVVVFGATLGIALDRAIVRCGRIAPARALLLQAIGAERIEALCDQFCASLSAEPEFSGLFPTARFSPGYGDLPLEFQQEIFRVLDCQRKIGLTLNDSMIMSPTKSVTAIVGLGSRRADTCTHSCRSCGKTDCIYRRRL